MSPPLRCAAVLLSLALAASAHAADAPSPKDAPVAAPSPAAGARPFVDVLELQVDVLGLPATPAWEGYFLGASVLAERHLLEGFGLGLYQALHLQPPSFGLMLISQTQLAAGYTLGWTGRARVQLGAYGLGGVLTAWTQGRASYPEYGVDQGYAAFSLRPVVGALLALRVWVTPSVAVSAQLYVPVSHFREQLLDNQAKLLSVGVTFGPG